MLKKNRKSKAQINTDKIFRPGTKLDVVFNIDTSSPIVRSAILYECSHKSKIMIISQTSPQILPSFRYERMDLTVLVEEELGKKFRCGVKCKIVNFVKDYQLSDFTKENAIAVQYSLPVQKMNLRTSFRLESRIVDELECSLSYMGNRYVSGKDFKVSNISTTGIGLLVPRQSRKEMNPLLNIEIGENLLFELSLVDLKSKVDRALKEEKKTVTTFIEVVRKTENFNKKSGLIGLRFCSVNKDYEDILGKFIHDAQLFDIRQRLS